MERFRRFDGSENANTHLNDTHKILRCIFEAEDVRLAEVRLVLVFVRFEFASSSAITRELQPPFPSLAEH